MQRVHATVLDVKTPQDRGPRLEVRFADEAASVLSSEHGGALWIDVGGLRYRATVGLTATNPPYFRGTLNGPEGKGRWTEVLQDLGVSAGDRIAFEVLTPRHELRLIISPSRS